MASGSVAPGGGARVYSNHYPPGVSSTDGAAYVVWSDTGLATDLTNSQDILLRKMDVQAASPP